MVEQLGAAVKRFPTNPEGTRGHFHLADSYRRLADTQMADATAADANVGKDKRDHALEMHRVY